MKNLSARGLVTLTFIVLVIANFLANFIRSL